jgi:transposase
MPHVATIGLDLAKNVFHVHGVDADGKVIIRRQVRRVDVLRCLRALRRVLSAWEPAPPLTTGRKRLLPSAIS